MKQWLSIVGFCVLITIITVFIHHFQRGGRSEILDMDPHGCNQMCAPYKTTGFVQGSGLFDCICSLELVDAGMNKKHHPEAIVPGSAIGVE